jgi:hypothetical protein
MNAKVQKNATLAAPESIKFGVELVGLYAALALSSGRAPVQEGIFQQPASSPDSLGIERAAPSAAAAPLRAFVFPPNKKAAATVRK